MSGRIAEYRTGYGDVVGYPDGYGCLGITQVHIYCMDCSGNKYLKVPVECESVIDQIIWTDYRETPIPTAYTHLCQNKLDTGYLEVEYPDVPPVSTRGITLRPSAAKPTDTCSTCWEYEDEDPPGERRAWYKDVDDNKVYAGDEFIEPAPPKTYDKAILSPSYYDFNELCSDLYPNESSKAQVLTFEHCLEEVGDLYNGYFSLSYVGNEITIAIGYLKAGNYFIAVAQDTVTATGAGVVICTVTYDSGYLGELSFENSITGLEDGNDVIIIATVEWAYGAITAVNRQIAGPALVTGKSV